MDRGTDGRLPRAPSLADESYMDFAESLRNLAIVGMFPHVARAAEHAVAAAGIDPKGEIGAIRAVADALPAVGTWKKLMRTQQHMAWDRVRAGLYADEATHAQALDAAARRAGNRLHVDPGFAPDAAYRRDIHLQPGGYTDDPLGGYVFHHGTKVFYQGQNDQDELHAAMAGFARVPEDGQVARIVDLGCSIGQGTTALKERFPDAEVWGLDVGLPMVRYANKRALDLGSDVHFVQALAERTGFADGSVDMAFAYILFHEVPAATFPAIMAEAARILRPGGTFTIIDAPNRDPRQAPVGQRLWQQFDAEFNEEPYAPDWGLADLDALLAGAGLAVLDRPPSPMFLEVTLARKP